MKLTYHYTIDVRKNMSGTWVTPWGVLVLRAEMLMVQVLGMKDWISLRAMTILAESMEWVVKEGSRQYQL